MGFLENSENIFQVAFQKKKKILSLIKNIESEVEDLQAANDSNYTPLTERIEEIEP